MLSNNAPEQNAARAQRLSAIWLRLALEITRAAVLAIGRYSPSTSANCADIDCAKVGFENELNH